VKTRRKSTYWGLIVVLIAAFLISGCGQKEEAVKETEISVNTAQVEERSIAKSARYAGIIRGQNEVYVMPKVAARVTGILVNPGDWVTQGQVLMTLDSSDYQASVAQLEAAVQNAAMNLENARLALERTQKLHEAGAASDADLEKVQTAYDAAQIAMDQANLNLSDMLSKYSLTAPISGVVGSINLSLGDMANPASPAAVISETSQLEIEVMVGESEINFIEVGSPVDVYIRAVSEEAFKGQVASVATVPDPVKRNYAVKVTLDNPEGKIKSGMFAEVAVNTLSKDNVICVPANAVVPKGARTVVYVVDEESRAREREVEIGIENSSYVEIVKGLSAGEQVITKGSTLVAEGTLVRVITGGAN